MEQQANLFELQLDQPSINYLNEACRWSRFLSIIGFIYCGLMVIAGLFFGSLMGRLIPAMSGDAGMPAMISGGFFSFFFILMSLIMFFPAFYLYNFSTKMRRALNNNDQPLLTDSLKNLKSFFKFYGIIVIIVLSFYALALVAGIIGAMVGRH
jgi:heme/copper-type cytochrome/quinol oxidase subunit 2